VYVLEVKEKKMNANVEKLKEMSNRDLLELYELMVRVNHYDPGETPKKAKEMYEAGINYETIGEIILEKMEKV